jgi:hypothetical protein
MALQPLSPTSKVVVYNDNVDLRDKTPSAVSQGVTIAELVGAVTIPDIDNFLPLTGGTVSGATTIAAPLTVSGGSINIETFAPQINFADQNSDSDFYFGLNGGILKVRDFTKAIDYLTFDSSLDALGVGVTMVGQASTWYGDMLMSDGRINISGVNNGRHISHTNVSDYDAEYFSRGGVESGKIRVTLGSTAYITSSDYRLKENVVSLEGAIDRVKNLNPVRFNFIGSDKTVDGFLAHEAATVVPEAIDGEKDAVDEEGNPVYQGIDQSKVVPLLAAALKEAIAKIEALETEVAALKA